ncbi:MAG TPA: site-2 protease family protein [Thermoanaerobaculia bacterium]|nr:site-2 protease family protein [Thermoanaerobaculia bacterium]
MPDAPISPDKVLEIVIQVAVLLFAVSVHESAHGWMALRCGDTTARDLGRITLNPVKHLDPFGSLLVPALLAFTGAPIFGWAKPVPVSLRGVRNPRRANLLVSAAGPVSNFAVALLGGMAFFALRALAPTGPELRTSLFYPLLLVALFTVAVNVSLGLFNLIPIPPLDGFGVVESFAPARWIRGVMWVRKYGFILLVVAIFTGGLSAVLGPPQRFLFQLLLGGPS